MSNAAISAGPNGPSASPDEGASRLVLCRTAEDFFQSGSRGLIGHLCRGFLDQMVLTPTEVIFSARNHTRLDGAGTMLRDVIERTAKMQAAPAGMQWQARQKELQGAIDQLVLKVREIEQAEPLIPLKEGMARATLAQIRATSSPDLLPYRVYRTLTDYLSGTRIWITKLEKLISLARELDGTSDFEFIDDLLAECISSEVAQEAMFGRSVSIDIRIDDLADLHRGDYPDRRNITPPPATEAINLMLRRHDMPALRAAIEASILQHLASRNPLNSPELMIELKATYGLLHRLKQGDKLLGGRRALDFIDKRMARLLTPEGIADYLRGAASVADRLIVLFEMHTVAFGQANRKVVETMIDRYMNDVDFDRRLLQGEGSPAHKLKLAATLYRAVATSALSAQTKQSLAQKLVHIQASFIQQSKLFAIIDRQNASTARKAQQIILLCLEGHFIPGENQTRAIALVRHYLSRPDFVERYLEGANTPEAREEHVTALNGQLRSLGIPSPFETT
jgi:hypothetical protein